MSEKYVLYEQVKDPSNKPMPYGHTLCVAGTPLDIFAALPMTPEEKLAAGLKLNKNLLRWSYIGKGEKYLTSDGEIFVWVGKSSYQCHLILDPAPEPEPEPEPKSEQSKSCGTCRFRAADPPEDFCYHHSSQPESQPCDDWESESDEWQVWLDKEPRCYTEGDCNIIGWIKTMPRPK